MFQLDDFLPYLVHRATAQLSTRFHAQAKTVGVTIEKWRVMAALLNAGEQSISEVSHRTTIEISTLSHLLKRMERDGLIERQRDGQDGRIMRIRFTQAGAVLARRLLPLVREYEQVALDGFTDEEAKLLKSMLKRVNHNLTRLPREPFPKTGADATI
jgi:DNA-binding MarR family transcriptional regulator